MQDNRIKLENASRKQFQKAIDALERCRPYSLADAQVLVDLQHIIKAISGKTLYNDSLPIYIKIEHC